jgi:ABC-type nitrate/sulfonate/bicarbonate transport system substrate-binding protein
MSGRITYVAALAASLALATGALGAETQLRTIAFPGASNLQTWVAQDRGFFAHEGLSVTLDATTGSVQEMRDLFAGKYQIMTSAFDNIVAYTEGQGERQIPDASDLVVFMGVHAGLDNLVARPEIKGVAELRGKILAVDAKKSGYAFILYELLQKRGLEANKDYTVPAVGGGRKRLEALLHDQAVASMLEPPLDPAAEKAGYHILASSRELGSYQGSTYVTRRSWAKAHETELSGYIRAIVAATDYIFKDKAGTVAILKQHMPRLGDATLDRTYATLTGPEGFDHKEAIDMQAVETVLKLREAYGEPKRKLDPPMTYIDESYYRRALAGK